MGVPEFLRLTLKALRDDRSGARVGYGNAVMPETVPTSSLT